jgi:hypothetical protein
MSTEPANGLRQRPGRAPAIAGRGRYEQPAMKRKLIEAGLIAMMGLVPSVAGAQTHRASPVPHSQPAPSQHMPLGQRGQPYPLTPHQTPYGYGHRGGYGGHPYGYGSGYGHPYRMQPYRYPVSPYAYRAPYGHFYGYGSPYRYQAEPYHSQSYAYRIQPYRHVYRVYPGFHLGLPLYGYGFFYDVNPSVRGYVYQPQRSAEEGQPVEAGLTVQSQGAKVQVSWSDPSGRQAREVTFFLADQSQTVLGSQTTVAAPYVARFDPVANTAFVGVTVDWADGAVSTAILPYTF